RPDVRRQGPLRRRGPPDGRRQSGLGPAECGAHAPRLGRAAAAGRRRHADRQDDHRRGVARHPRREPVRWHAAQPGGARPRTRRLVVAVDAFGFADAATAAALQPLVQALAALMKEVRDEPLAPPGLTTWARAQRTLQPWEAWQTFKPWLERDNPRLQYSVARNLARAAAIPESEREWAALVRSEARARMTWLLPPGTILCMPTTPFPAPLKG